MKILQTNCSPLLYSQCNACIVEYNCLYQVAIYLRLKQFHKEELNIFKTVVQ